MGVRNTFQWKASTFFPKHKKILARVQSPCYSFPAMKCHRCCANCRFALPDENRYDQVYCFNENSIHGEGNVEASDCCEYFEESKENNQ